MAEVTITKAQLETAHACNVYLDSPEWNGEALVYADWNATVDRLLSTRGGITYLNFLVVRGLVPMKIDEYLAARKSRQGI